MTRTAEQIKHKNPCQFKNYQFFIGENINPEAQLLCWTTVRTVPPYMIFFKEDLEMEKCLQIWQFFSITCHRYNWLLLFIHTPGLGQIGLMLSWALYLLENKVQKWYFKQWEMKLEKKIGTRVFRALHMDSGSVTLKNNINFQTWFSHWWRI